MRKIWKRLFSLLLAVILCLGMIPVSASAAGEAMDLAEVKKLLNSVELHPQRTGYPEIDQALEAILKPYEKKDTYTKIKALYDWSVSKISYSWNGYSQNWAPAYDKFTLKYDLEYETGLPEAYPKDMIYRAYHMLTARTGVCYDWGILFAVMARYVGIESYVHTGILRIGSWTGHHGWTELRIAGKNYIFDAQQENRLLGLEGVNNHEHFCIPTPAARWQEETKANAARDKSLLPVTAERVRTASVTVQTSRSGQVKGAGRYPWGSMVTLTSAGELPVEAWYSMDGKLLCSNPSFSFFLDGNAEFRALFEGDVFVDIPAGAWYLEDACQAGERGLISGMSPGLFQGSGTMTRAMLASVLSKVDEAETETIKPAPFTDVNQGSWYAPAVNWAYEKGVVSGVSQTKFDPNSGVTREQAAVMMVQYLEGKGIAAESEGPEFTDAGEISSYAAEKIGQARSLGLLAGYKDGTIRPKALITRAEGAALLMNVVRCLEAA